MAYIVYDSQWNIKGTYTTLREINTLYGLDIKKEDTENLTIKKGKRVVKEEDIKDKIKIISDRIEDVLLERYQELYSNMEEKTVKTLITIEEKDEEIKGLQESIELEKERRLDDLSKIIKYRNLISELREDLIKLSKSNHEIIKGIGKEYNDGSEDDAINKEDFEEKNEPTNLEEDKEEKDLKSEDECEGITEVTREENYTELDLPKEDKNWEENQEKIEGSKPNKRRGYVDFIRLLDGDRIHGLKELKGKKVIQTKKVAVLSNLEEHDVQYLVHTVLKGMGTLPSYTNTKIISPSEALWVIIASRAKREGYVGRSKVLQKATLNGKDFYESWITQKSEIERYLS